MVWRDVPVPEGQPPKVGGTCSVGVYHLLQHPGCYSARLGSVTLPAQLCSGPAMVLGFGSVTFDHLAAQVF